MTAVKNRHFRGKNIRRRGKMPGIRFEKRSFDARVVRPCRAFPVSGDPAAVQDDRIENTVIREGPGAVLRTQDVRTVFVTDQVLVVGGQQVQRDAGGLRRTAGFVHE